MGDGAVFSGCECAFGGELIVSLAWGVVLVCSRGDCAFGGECIA